MSSIDDLRRRVEELTAANQDLERLAGELRASLQNTADVVESISDGFYFLDAEWRFRYVSAKAADFWGRTPESLLGRRIWDVFPEGPKTEAYRHMVRAMVEKEQCHLESFSDYTKRWMSISLYPNEKGLAVLFRDISERKRNEAALRDSEARFRTLHESLRDPLIEVAMDGRILGCNDLFCRMLGYTHEEIRSLSYQALTPERWHAMQEDIVRSQIIPRGYSDIYEEEYRRKDGTVFPVELRSVLARDDEGRPKAMWAVVRDISHRKRAEASLREANDKLLEADRRKNEFLAILSHELRNPLAPLQNSLHILDHVEPGCEAAEAARATIKRQVNQLVHLVGDLLDLTRITRGKIEIRREPTELTALLRRTCEDQTSEFRLANVDLDLRLPERAVWVAADPPRLAQAISNLLQNAAKFTNPGGRVVVSADEKAGNVRISVRDNGIGIAPDLVESLFEPFTQADVSLDRTRGGLGLGLSLVRGLAELHGGSVEAHSEGPGRGAEFVLQIPALQEPGAVSSPGGAGAPGAVSVRQATPDGATANGATGGAAAALKTAGQAAAGAVSGKAPPAGPRVEASARRRVLIIEDNTDSASSLSAVLRLLGHTVEVTHTGPDGIERARCFRPDVVLCDIGLPRMDGYAVARAFRSDPELRSTVLIALSGYALPEDLAKGKEAGFSEHVAKPATVAQLQGILSAVPSFRVLGEPGAGSA